VTKRALVIIVNRSYLSYLSLHPTFHQWEEGGVAAAPLPLASESGIVSIASFAAPYPLMASRHQWKAKK